MESRERHRASTAGSLQSDGLGDSQVRDHEYVLGLQAVEERKIALPRKASYPHYADVETEA